MTVTPKISVFIAAYNHARYLPECLDSILAQTYQDFEIVVVDDGSTDNSISLLEDYARRYPTKVRVFWHPEHVNKGISATSNLAIKMSGGEYLAWTGSDDVWYPSKLEQQIRLFEQNPALGMVYSYADFIDSDSNIIPGRSGTDITQDTNPLAQIIQYCHTPEMTVVFRRQCLDDVGLFDESVVYGDWDLMIRVFSRWKVGFTNQSLAKYRMHQHNISKGIDPQVDLRRIIAMYRLVEKQRHVIGGLLKEPRNQAMIDLQLAFHLFCNMEMGEASKYLLNAFEHDPGLQTDFDFLSTWLNRWKPAFYTSNHPHFGLWVLANLPATFNPAEKGRLLDLELKSTDTTEFYIKRGVDRGQSQVGDIDISGIFDDCPSTITLTKNWKDSIYRKVYPTLLFNSSNDKDRRKVRSLWKKTILKDPQWLKNRGVWSIGMGAILKREVTVS